MPEDRIKKPENIKKEDRGARKFDLDKFLKGAEKAGEILNKIQTDHDTEKR